MRAKRKKEAKRALKAQQSRKGEMRKVQADFGDTGDARKFLMAGDWSAEAYERVLSESTIAMPHEENGEEILETLSHANGSPNGEEILETLANASGIRHEHAHHHAPERTTILRVAFEGIPEAEEAGLAAALRAQLGAAMSVGTMASGSSLLIRRPPSLIDPGAEPVAKPAHRPKLQIVLDEIETEASAGEHRAVSRFAAAERAHIVGVNDLVRRYGTDRMLEGSALGAFGLEVVADAILIVAAQQNLLPAVLHASPLRSAPNDLIEASDLAQKPLDLLSKLSWDAPTPPKLIEARLSRSALEAFADSQIALEHRGSSRLLPIGESIDWNVPLESEREAASFFGLSFLSSVLLYWYVKASGKTNDDLAAIDKTLKEKGVTASALLSRSGSIIADFAEQCRPSKTPSAWTRPALVQRAKVLLLFLLACRAAARRRIRFDAALCTPAFLGLVDAIEFLRRDSGAAIGQEEGISQIGFLVGIALPLRRMTYGRILLEECFNHLATFHLAAGLSEDGVWRGTFEEHCGTLKAAVTLLVSVRALKLSAALPVSAAAEQMTAFVEAMLRGNSLPPPINHIAQVSHEKNLKLARTALSVPGAKPIEPRATYVLPDTGYFISHTRGEHGPASSQLVVHAAAGDVRHKRPGRFSLSFCIGDTDLVIGGGAISRKVPKDIAAILRTDLASGNEYRVNGTSYGAAESVAPDAIALERSWEGRGWAAATFVNTAHADARIRRTAIHLKPVHALLVVDELTSKSGSECVFEQFWHLAPDMIRQGDLYQFATTAPGCLSVAFDSGGSGPDVLAASTPQDNPISWSVSRDGELVPHPVVRRTLSTGNGLAVSLFQWSREPAPLNLRHGGLQEDGWMIEALGKSFEVRFALRGDDLARLDKSGT